MDLAGNAGTQATATTNSSAVTLDRTPPTITASIISNNSTTTLAKPGDDVTLTVTSSENLYQAPTATIDGNAASVSPSTQTTSYTATRTMASGDTDGAVAFVLSGVTDLAGNTVSNVTATTDASSVRFDSVVPTVDAITIASNNNYDNDNTTSLAKSGDSVTVSFTTSENIQAPTVTIAQGTATVSGSDAVWSATIAMTDSDPDGAVAFTVDYLDLAGNAGTQVTSVTSGGNVTFDNTAPTISSATIASNNAVNTLAKVGDVVTVTITSAEDLYSLASLAINSQSVDVAQVTKTSATEWSFTYTMTSSDTEGNLDFGFTANDLTGNSSALTYSSSLTFDRTAPTLSAVSL